MPLYEYYCQDCKTKFERLAAFTKADDGLVCQTCHGVKVRRLLSVFAARRGGDGEFGDGESFGGFSGGACGCGGACACGGHDI